MSRQMTEKYVSALARPHAETVISFRLSQCEGMQYDSHANMATSVHTFTQPAGLTTCVYIVVTQNEAGSSSMFKKSCLTHLLNSR